ncbi:DUF6382 domain-containing protein [Anaerovorax sp. IOR16]|uniref:DUF6382 domain-containing protein n=1 Tax=Anaerovorax sp. IOR16 TaxID=2773458 RepID=UPI0019CF8BD9|nr:DUF6382 domain-containing protein [Anaerovorax sp. IOR16]
MIAWKGKEAEIETINGKRTIKLEMSECPIPFYQKEILSLSSTGYFLPMKFVFLEETCQIYYDCSERISLEQYLKGKRENGIFSFVEQGIQLLEHFLEQIQQGENHLLFLADYQLSFDLLFVNEKKQKVELLFLPKEKIIDFSEEWKNILTKIEQIMNDKQWSVYSQKLIFLQMEHNFGIEELLICLRDMKGQICYS